VAYSKAKPNSALTDLLTASETVIPPSVSPAVDTLRSLTLAANNIFSFSTASTTLGGRYDFHPKAAVKLEFQLFERPTISVFNEGYENPTKNSVLATTVALDFVL
jgi:hypothetical protein